MENYSGTGLYRTQTLICKEGRRETGIKDDTQVSDPHIWMALMLFTKSGEIGSDKSCKRRTHELSLRCAEFEVLTSYPSRDLGLDIHYPLVSLYLQIHYFFASHHGSWRSMTRYPSKAEIVLLIVCVSVWSVCFSAECVCMYVFIRGDRDRDRDRENTH